MNKNGRWGLERNGRISWCKAEKMGGRGCPHIEHQREDETLDDFNERCNKIRNKSQRLNEKYGKGQNHKITSDRIKMDYEKSLGQYFESELYDRMEMVSNLDVAKKNHIEIKKSTKKQDEEEGTDLFVTGIPVDLTINQDKNYTQWMDSMQASYSTIDFGIRAGNGKVNFKNGVVVVKFNHLFQNKREMTDCIENSLTDNEILDMVEKIFNVFYEYEDQQEEDRKSVV